MVKRKRAPAVTRLRASLKSNDSKEEVKEIEKVLLCLLEEIQKI